MRISYRHICMIFAKETFYLVYTRFVYDFHTKKKSHENHASLPCKYMSKTNFLKYTMLTKQKKQLYRNQKGVCYYISAIYFSVIALPPMPDCSPLFFLQKNLIICNLYATPKTIKRSSTMIVKVTMAVTTCTFLQKMKLLLYCNDLTYVILQML